MSTQEPPPSPPQAPAASTVNIPSVYKTPKVDVRIPAMLAEFTSTIADIPLIAFNEIAGYHYEHESMYKVKVVLIDTRTRPEYEVSTVKGEYIACHMSDFNIDKYDFGNEVDEKSVVSRVIFVPFCTIGYRSGQYARNLLKGIPKAEINGVKYEVRNGAGVVPWSWEGSCEFVVPSSSTSAPASKIHTFAKNWDVLPEKYQSVQFASSGVFGTVIGGFYVVKEMVLNLFKGGKA